MNWLKGMDIALPYTGYYMRYRRNWLTIEIGLNSLNMQGVEIFWGESDDLA